MKKYIIEDIYHLVNCPNVKGKKIGSAGCTSKSNFCSCEYCSEYCSDFIQDTDDHGRIDSISFTCNFNNDEVV